MKRRSKITEITLPDDEAIVSALLLGALFQTPIATWNGPHHYTHEYRPMPSKDLPARTKGEAARDYIRALTRAKP